MEEVYGLLRVVRELADHPPGAFPNIMKYAVTRLKEIEAGMVEPAPEPVEEPIEPEPEGEPEETE